MCRSFTKKKKVNAVTSGLLNLRNTLQHAVTHCSTLHQQHVVPIELWYMHTHTYTSTHTHTHTQIHVHTNTYTHTRIHTCSNGPRTCFGRASSKVSQQVEQLVGCTHQRVESCHIHVRIYIYVYACIKKNIYTCAYVCIYKYMYTHI